MGWGSIGGALGVAGKALGLGTSIAGLAQEGIDPSQRNITNAIRIRVRDAKAAGVHPLFALGANVGGPVSPVTGSGVGDAVSALGGSIDALGAKKQAAQAQSLQNRQIESAIKVNETQAMLNEARSRSVIAEMQNNPGILNTITSMPLAPLDTSHHIDPSTGRLTEFTGADGKKYQVDQSVAPSEVLDREFGESSELQGIARLIKGMYGYKGTAGGPSMKEIIGWLTK